MPDPLPGSAGGYEVVATRSAQEEIAPVRERLQAMLGPNQIRVQAGQMERLRDQENIEAMQVSPSRLLLELTALQGIGRYDPRALGEAKMLVTANGTEQVEHRHKDDPSLVGTSTQAEQARYLVTHFEYVARLAVNWKWPVEAKKWAEMRKIVEKLRAELASSYEKYRLERVGYGEADTDADPNSGTAISLRKGRDDGIYSKYAISIRTIVDDAITMLQVANPNP